MPSLTETYVENRVIVNPNDANNLGAAHGGNVMKWMDEVAAMAAMRFAGETCVTARMDQTNFRRPIPQADIALVKAYVFEAGETSVKTRVRVFREDPHSGETELTTESYMVFVAIDENDEPTPVPELTVDTERGQELFEAAVNGEE
ncbi:acyl-CoA thioesterase [Haloarchaeobius iranensis]|uniref:Acyl-CoA hydrolase n=1 Tax=Haloarchaeobius iranensis TaxID=996166 RepID=A0A1H0AS52_9EURY|nr:acyl-CoA thioesterase [Haloarchaeobius iranensis]SDN35856.1 Acyl-CoA hydrolase [Haloarchaeobius iranensis]